MPRIRTPILRLKPKNATNLVIRTAGSAVGRLLTRARWRYYVAARGRRIVSAMPVSLRKRAGLADERAIGSRRIEVGGGPYAQAGYIHIDLDPDACHLEAVAPAWSLPFPDAWAEEVLAIHTLEHVPPPKLLDVLREWRRVLSPQGKVKIHVPNSPALFQVFTDSNVEQKWAIMGAILGMYGGPDAKRPEELTFRSDHQIIFDFPLLEWALQAAGFNDIQDITAASADRHIIAWRDVVSHCSLVVVATR